MRVKELEVIGVRIEVPSNQPLVLLKETSGPRYLPIWMGAPEASAIAFEQQGIRPPRPMTHDLLITVIGNFSHQLQAVTITAVEDTTFHARLEFDDGSSVSSRASDAIALALRAHCPIRCVDEVLEDSGVLMDAEDEEDEASASQEAQLRQFREFLDDVEPEDFER